MYRFIHTMIIGAFFASTSLAQPIGNYKNGFSKKDNELSFFTSNARVKIEFCTADVFRVRTSWNNSFEENEPWMVVKYNWAPVTIQTTENSNFFLLKTSRLSIKVFKTPFSIDVLTAEGKLLSSEKKIGNTAAANKNGDTVSSHKQLLPNEHFFGFGERMDFIDQRSKKVKLSVGRGKGLPHEVGAYNVLEANYCPVPFFMSTQGYGIFLHNAYATEWDMGTSSNEQYSFSAAGGELDYYFFYGPSFPYILQNYTTLTGKAPLMPLFALGLQVGTYAGGTWGYEQLTSDTYVIELARKLRALGIPVDVLHLDSVWRIFGKNGGKGATSFEWRETFKNPAAMFDSLYAMNYKMVGMHLRPRFDNGNYVKLLDTARQLGYTYPEKNNPGEFVNFFDEKAVGWWFEHGVKRIAAVGAKFLKTDEGSAFGSLANESDKVGPTGKEISKLHNLFPLAYAKAPYEKFQQYNNMRGMNHTREGYAGIQRYPFIFAGDWPSEWQYFAPVIKAGLNIGISGVGNWAHCMGGFEHVADPELYIRWCQFGLMSPVAHLFGMDHPAYKEPWNYGEEALSIFKKYDSLRYRLIPYLYSHSYQMHTTGMPLMQALVLQYQNDENVYNISDQYMLGQNIMVCPVTTKAAKTRIVYFPEGDWYDYNTGKKYTGKQYVNIVTPLSVLPMFVKAGSIIPMQPGMVFIGDKPVNEITLDVYSGNNTSFEMYEDDGVSLQYQNKEFAITKISVSSSVQQLTLNIQKPVGKFQPTPHTYLAKLHITQVPTSITQNGKPSLLLTDKATINNTAGWYYDAQEKILWIKTVENNKTDNEVVVLFNN